MASNSFNFNHVDVWLARLDRIIQTAAEWETHMAKPLHQQLASGSQNDPINAFEKEQIASLEAMLANLRAYATDIASWYIKGTLPPERQLPAGKTAETHLLQLLLDCFSTDLALLQTALSQRLRPSNTRLSGSQILLDADIFTKELIAPTHKHLNRDILAELTQPQSDTPYNPSVAIEFVTYFTDSIRVRSLPYYQGTVLIGLPFSTTNIGRLQKEESPHVVLGKSIDSLSLEASVPWNFLVLAHEAAHYLYWNGKNAHDNSHDMLLNASFYLTDKIRQSINLEGSDWRAHWLEELFCDVYSCLILGPVAALGLQAMLADADPSTLFTNSGAHPIPGLRPLIATQVLEIVYPGRFPNAIKKLDDQWHQYLASAGLSGKLAEKVKMHHPDANIGGWLGHTYRDHSDTSLQKIAPATLNWDGISKALTEVIEAIQQSLMLSPPAGSRFADLPWSTELQAQEPLSAYASQLQEIIYWPSDQLIPFSSADNVIVDFKNDLAYQDVFQSKGDDLVQLLEYLLAVWGDKGGGDTKGTRPT